MSLGERLVNRRHDVFIPQNLIGVGHPFFAKVAHLFGDQTLTARALGAVAGVIDDVRSNSNAPPTGGWL
jgi:hypothetical protein